MLNDHYKLLFPVTLQYLWNAKRKHVDFLSSVIRRHYFGNREIGQETAAAITEVFNKKNQVQIYSYI